LLQTPKFVSDAPPHCYSGIELCFADFSGSILYELFKPRCYNKKSGYCKQMATERVSG